MLVLVVWGVMVVVVCMCMCERGGMSRLGFVTGGLGF